MPLDISKVHQPSESESKQLLNNGAFAGLDDRSIRQLMWQNPQVFFAALSQKFYDLILFPLRAGWSALTWQERQNMPWLATALEWGLQSEELYQNAHALPTKHPLKNESLIAAKQMDNWENQHSFIATICAYSKPLDKLIGQPVPIGPDGWPVNQLDHNGNDRDLSEIYADVYLFYHRLRPHISPSLRRHINHLASQALSSGRLTLLAS